MRKHLAILFMTALFGFAILCAGCGGPKNESVQPIVEAEASPSGARTSPEEVDLDSVPEWFLNIPSDPDYLYAVGTSAQKYLSSARKYAISDARVNISSQISTKVSGLFKRFREEVGVGEDANMDDLTTAISQEVVSEVLNGCKVKKQDMRKEGIRLRFYVLVEMPVGMAESAVIRKVKDNKNLYTQFRASQAFKELEEEVGKYEQAEK